MKDRGWSSPSKIAYVNQKEHLRVTNTYLVRRRLSGSLPLCNPESLQCQAGKHLQCRVAGAPGREREHMCTEKLCDTACCSSIEDCVAFQSTVLPMFTQCFGLSKQQVQSSHVCGRLHNNVTTGSKDRNRSGG